LFGAKSPLHKLADFERNCLVSPTVMKLAFDSA